jgi:type 1 glutamine amidotransferase
LIDKLRKTAMIRSKISSSLVLFQLFLASPIIADQPWATFPGGDGPGHGKHIVLVSGDEEYRSEDVLPQLAKILSQHHGFQCTVLFAVDPATGEINPNVQNNIPGLEVLKDADLLILFTRFRNLPDEQMQHLADYIESGKPILGLRTATHAFDIPADRKFAKYGWKNTKSGYDQGFGRQVLGETWISHHGKHGKQSTRGIIVPGKQSHPILRGIADGEIWGPTDVYGVRQPLPDDCEPLVLGAVLEGMKPGDKPIAGEKNDPMMPIAWTKTYTGAAGKPARVFTTTMGSGQDLENEAFRRLLVNACYWCLEKEAESPSKAKVDLVGDYEARRFRTNGFKPGVKPADHELP